MGGVSERIPVECTRGKVGNSRSTPNRHTSFGEYGEPVLVSPLRVLCFSEGLGAGSPGLCIQLASIDFFQAGFRRGTGGIWGCSSAGRAPDLHSGGRRFDPDQLHQCQPKDGTWARSSDG